MALLSLASRPLKMEILAILSSCSYLCYRRITKREDASSGQERDPPS